MNLRCVLLVGGLAQILQRKRVLIIANICSSHGSNIGIDGQITRWNDMLKQEHAAFNTSAGMGQIFTLRQIIEKTYDNLLDAY
uniref:Uncharacterized protein n=1 Tax=Megaselia scalaris TaxID=36166 RepID=T1H3P7_MEGSC